MKKKLEQSKTSFATVFKNVKGFGTLPEPEKKKVKMNNFIKVLGKDK